MKTTNKKLTKENLFRYYGSPDIMKLIEVDEFNRTVIFKVNKELISIPFALTGLIEEYDECDLYE